MIVASRRITAAHAIFKPRRLLIRLNQARTTPSNRNALTTAYSSK
jgi:hypothetical protein